MVAEIIPLDGGPSRKLPKSKHFSQSLSSSLNNKAIVLYIGRIPHGFYEDEMLGHGRSVVVTCALLVALGVVDNWKDAEKLIKERRPCISMNSLHRQSLEEWSKHRLSPLKRNS